MPVAGSGPSDGASGLTGSVEQGLREVQADLDEWRERLPSLHRRRAELVALALSRGMSQAYLAEVLGLSPGRVAQIVRELVNSDLPA
jgi:DNA-directed RNA polymerase specialized sigma subunit